MHKVSQVIGISFLYYLSSLESPLLLSSSSYHTDPNTRKERAIYHPHKRPRPRLRPKQPCELPCNMHAHVTCISNHILRLRARRSELRVRSLVSGSCSSRSISVAPVPASASGANVFVSLNSPESWPSEGDLPLAQSLCERSTWCKGGVGLTMFLGFALLARACFA